MQMSAATTPDSGLPKGVRGHYQLPDSKMTLREGLAEYYQVNPGLSDPATIDNPASAAFFHHHDTTHVIFGTHTGPLDEGVNDMLTIFGVDVRLRDYYTGYIKTDESKSINQQFLNRSVFKLFWQTLKLTPQAWRHSRAMTKKWPWAPPAAFLDRPLDELRAEYGIEVFRPDVALGLA
jgi:hypothetical protein